MAFSLEELQERQRQREAERSAAARKRFDDSHLSTVIKNPTRFSPFEVQAAHRYLNEYEGKGQEGERRRQFDETQKTQRQQSADNRDGMIGQGATAAGLKADAERDVAATEWSARQKMSEQEQAAKRYLADQEAWSKRMEISVADENGKRRYGYFDKDGNYIGGSDFNTADVAGEHQARAEASRAAAELEMRLMGLQSRDGIEARKDETRRMGMLFRAAQKDNEARAELIKGFGEGKFGMNLGRWQKMTREQQDNWLQQMSLNFDSTIPAAGAAGTGQGVGTGQGAGGWRGALNW